MAFIDKAKAKEISAQHLADMEMNETYELGSVLILRVWGGWIYYTIDISSTKITTATFVPLLRTRD